VIDHESRRELLAFEPVAAAGDELLWQNERSRVYRRTSAGRNVILKEALGVGAASRVRHERLMLERLAGVRGVPQLVAVADATWIAFEDVGGMPLSVPFSPGAFVAAPLVAFALELAEIVAAVHRAGIVHRDINPSNILVVGCERHPLLIDFHIASSSAVERPAFTAHNEIEGTLAFIAPEQTGRTGRTTDHRADLYALGATLYELATGHRPFASADLFELIRDLLLRAPDPPATLDPSIPAPLSEIVMRLLEKEPDARYQSAAGLAADLRELLGRLECENRESFRLGEHDFPERLTPPSRLVGRETELTALRAAFDDALSGRCNALLIAGVPGVGKTALSNELRPIVTAGGGWFVAGKFDRSRLDVDSDAVIRALRSLLRLLLAEPDEELVPLRPRLHHALGANLTLATATLPELAMLLRIDAQPMSEALVEVGRLYRIGIDVLRTLAEIRPVVFVLDDLQWASATPLGFVDAVVSDAGIPGLLFVGTYRVGDVDAAHPLSAMRSRWDRLTAAPRSLLLKNLERHDLGTLLEEMLRLRPSDALRFADAIAARTDGNPYDSTELLNALRRDGALTHGRTGWTWDDAAIRRYVGAGDVVDLLTARIDALPPDAADVLEIMACLGGEVESSLLAAAAGCSASELAGRMTPALDDGLIVLERGDDAIVRFRHDRVGQAANSRLDRGDRPARHLAIATRLEAIPAYEATAAEQYLPVLERIIEPAQRRRCMALFRAAANQARLVANDIAVERFLTAAVTMHGALAVPDDTLATDLDNEMHAALYRLGRLAEADAIYRSIVQRCGDAALLVDPACAQISSLTNRGRFPEALTLGIDLLARLGFALPSKDRFEASIERRLTLIAAWRDDGASRAIDRERPDAVDERATAAAKLINRMMPPAVFSDPAMLAWLVLESLDLWAQHGPQPLLVGPICHVGIFSARLDDIYHIGYRIGRHVLGVSESRAYPQTSIARFLFALGSMPWFESFRAGVVQAQIARDGLLASGDLQNAVWTYNASIPLLLECAATVDEYAAEIQAGFDLCARTGNLHSLALKVPHRQLARALLGQTTSVGGFSDESFAEEEHLAAVAHNPTAAVYYFVVRAQCAYIFGNMADLIHATDAAMPLLPTMIGQPLTAPAHLLRAIALTHVAQTAPARRSAALAELDRCLNWLRARAADAPGNFLHWVHLVEAERAWALGDFAGATVAFEAARCEALLLSSPMHRALIAERSGLCYLAHGIEEYGRLLIAGAHQSYDAWGAAAKVRRLEADHPFLRDSRRLPGSRAVTTVVLTSDTVDMVAILKASQALSSQTNLGRLKEQVVELLSSLTGATSVRLILADKDTSGWFYSPAGGDAAEAIPVHEAGARGLVPLSAFNFVERTREPLLAADATRDDRLARDRYFAACTQCSLLAVPIMSQGELRAVAVLENRLRRDAFSQAGLGAVGLIAGQLAVSLDNVLLYASLERKVAERTEALAAANAQLAQLSRTDAMTGITNRRGFDEQFRRCWQRALRNQTPIALAMIDVDEFKKYNDGYGHAAGDACLARVAAALGDGVRDGSDVAARYGGEEFVLILSDSDAATALAVAERLRSNVAELREPHAFSGHGIVTISIGIVAAVPVSERDAADILKAADDALYEAKRGGRNRVVLGRVSQNSRWQGAEKLGGSWCGAAAE
jgi:diguanylate cyclase (GGDEF)-like protein